MQQTGSGPIVPNFIYITYLERILDAAEGRGIAALVGMDVPDKAEVRALEEADLLLDGLARRQFGSGQGRELLACMLVIFVCRRRCVMYE